MRLQIATGSSNTLAVEYYRGFRMDSGFVSEMWAKASLSRNELGFNRYL